MTQTLQHHPEKRNRLAWQCRRGMRELDELLLGFLNRRYPTLGETQCDCFARLLEYPDGVLLEWLMGRMVPTDRDVAHIVREIRHTARP
ncbi:MAG: succinate dehydrogenase assembly factor 2 [Gammaproteobacteria bacterium]|jgi:antitoxin CptB